VSADYTRVIAVDSPTTAGLSADWRGLATLSVWHTIWLLPGRWVGSG